MGKSKSCTTDCAGCDQVNRTKASVEQTNKWKESPQESAKRVAKKKKASK